MPGLTDIAVAVLTSVAGGLGGRALGGLRDAASRRRAFAQLWERAARHVDSPLGLQANVVGKARQAFAAEQIGSTDDLARVLEQAGIAQERISPLLEKLVPALNDECRELAKRAEPAADQAFRIQALSDHDRLRALAEETRDRLVSLESRLPTSAAAIVNVADGVTDEPIVRAVVRYATTLLCEAEYARAKQLTEDVLEEAGSTDGDNAARARVVNVLGCALFGMQGDPDSVRSARERWEEAAELDPSYAAPRANLAWWHIAREQWQAAEGRAREALDLDESHTGAQTAWARIVARREGVRPALEYLGFRFEGEECVAPEPIGPKAGDFAVVAELLVWAHLWDEAADWAREAVERGPQFPAHHHLLAIALLHKATGGITRYYDACASLRRPLAEQARKEAEIAADGFQKEGRLRERADALNTLAFVCLLLGQPHQATDAAKEALAADPSLRGASQTLAQAYAELGDIEAALEAFGDVRAHGASAKVNYVSLLLLSRRGKGRTDADALDEAEEILAPVLADAPRVAQREFMLAELLASEIQFHRDPPSGIAKARALVGKWPDTPEPLLACADLLRLAQNVEEARRLLEKAKGMPGAALQAGVALADLLLFAANDATAALSELDGLLPPSKGAPLGLQRAAYRLAAQAAFESAQHDRCVDYVQEAEEAGLGDDTLHELAARGLLLAGRWNGALREYEKIPRERWHYRHLRDAGVAMLAAGRPLAATEALSVAAQTSEGRGDADLFTQLTKLWILRGMKGRALQAATKAKGLAAADAEAPAHALHFFTCQYWGEQLLGMKEFHRLMQDSGELPWVHVLRVDRQLSQVRPIFEQRRKRVAQLLGVYRKTPLPYESLAEALGMPFAAVWEWRKRPDLCLDAHVTGSAQEQAAVLGHRAAVVDYLALMTMGLLGALEHLEDAFDTLWLPAPMFTQIQNDLLKENHPVLRRVWEFLVNSPNVQVTDPVASDLGELSEAEDVIGSHVMSLLHAAKQAEVALITDCYRLKHVARPLGIPTAGTAAILAYLVDEHDLPPELRHQGLIRLVEQDYCGVPIEAETIVWSAELHNWRPNPQTRRLLQLAAHEHNSFVYYAGRVNGFVKYVWHSDLDLEAKLRWASEAARALAAADKRPMWRRGLKRTQVVAALAWIGASALDATDPGSEERDRIFALLRHVGNKARLSEAVCAWLERLRAADQTEQVIQELFQVLGKE